MIIAVGGWSSIRIVGNEPYSQSTWERVKASCNKSLARADTGMVLQAQLATALHNTCCVMVVESTPHVFRVVNDYVDGRCWCRWMRSRDAAGVKPLLGGGEEEGAQDGGDG